MEGVDEMMGSCVSVRRGWELACLLWSSPFLVWRRELGGGVGGGGAHSGGVPAKRTEEYGGWSGYRAHGCGCVACLAASSPPEPALTHGDASWRRAGKSKHKTAAQGRTHLPSQVQANLSGLCTRAAISYFPTHQSDWLGLSTLRLPASVSSANLAKMLGRLLSNLSDSVLFVL